MSDRGRADHPPCCRGRKPPALLPLLSFWPRSTFFSGISKRKVHPPPRRWLRKSILSSEERPPGPTWSVHYLFALQWSVRLLYDGNSRIDRDDQRLSMPTSALKTGMPEQIPLLLIVAATSTMLVA